MELRMGEGLAPWLRASLAQLLHGRAERLAAAAFDRLLAQLADADERIEGRIRAAALPGSVRERLLAGAQAVAAHAETTAARLACEVERRALEEIAACCDALTELPDTTAQDRERIAQGCEALILELTYPLGGAAGNRTAGAGLPFMIVSPP